MAEQPDIIYTKVDEAPELASGSFVPIIQAFTGVAGIKIGSKDTDSADIFPEFTIYCNTEVTKRSAPCLYRVW